MNPLLRTLIDTEKELNERRAVRVMAGPWHQVIRERDELRALVERLKEIWKNDRQADDA